MKTLGLLLACLHFTGVIALSAGFLNRTNVDVSFDDVNLVRVLEGVFLKPGLKDEPKPLQDGAELKVLKYGPYWVQWGFLKIEWLSLLQKALNLL